MLQRVLVAGMVFKKRVKIRYRFMFVNFNVFLIICMVNCSNQSLANFMGYN